MRNIFNTLRQLAADFRFAMCRLNEIQFNAPWKQARSRCS